MVFSKITNFDRRQFNNSIASVLGIVGFTTCLLITGCNNTDDTKDLQSTVEKTQTSEQSQEGEVIGQSVVSNDESKTDADSGTDSKEVNDGKPVSYDVQNWKAYEEGRLTTADITKLQHIFGDVKLTDEHSLDYASNMAVKYRFMKGSDPYLDIIDSKQYVEFGWYYANPNDTESEKKISVDHAKKAYQAATALMGEEGGNLVSRMLSGQSVKNKEVGGQQVELAKCEFYSCILTLKK